MDFSFSLNKKTALLSSFIALAAFLIPENVFSMETEREKPVIARKLSKKANEGILKVKNKEIYFTKSTTQGTLISCIPMEHKDILDTILEVLKSKTGVPLKTKHDIKTAIGHFAVNSLEFMANNFGIEKDKERPSAQKKRQTLNSQNSTFTPPTTEPELKEFLEAFITGNFYNTDEGKKLAPYLLVAPSLLELVLKRKEQAVCIYKQPVNTLTLYKHLGSEQQLPKKVFSILKDVEDSYVLLEETDVPSSKKKKSRSSQKRRENPSANSLSKTKLGRVEKPEKQLMTKENKDSEEENLEKSPNKRKRSKDKPNGEPSAKRHKDSKERTSKTSSKSKQQDKGQPNGEAVISAGGSSEDDSSEKQKMLTKSLYKSPTKLVKLTPSSNEPGGSLHKNQSFPSPNEKKTKRPSYSAEESLVEIKQEDIQQQNGTQVNPTQRLTRNEKNIPISDESSRDAFLPSTISTVLFKERRLPGLPGLESVPPVVATPVTILPISDPSPNSVSQDQKTSFLLPAFYPPIDLTGDDSELPKIKLENLDSDVMIIGRDTYQGPRNITQLQLENRNMRREREQLKRALEEERRQKEQMKMELDLAREEEEVRRQEEELNCKKQELNKRKQQQEQRHLETLRRQEQDLERENTRLRNQLNIKPELQK